MTDINVKNVIESTDFMRADGAVLAEAVSRALQAGNDDVRLDFAEIDSATSSGTCGFFSAVVKACGEQSVSRLIFSNASAWVMDSLEIGHERITGHKEHA